MEKMLFLPGHGRATIKCSQSLRVCCGIGKKNIHVPLLILKTEFQVSARDKFLELIVQALLVGGVFLSRGCRLQPQPAASIIKFYHDTAVPTHLLIVYGCVTVK